MWGRRQQGCCMWHTVKYVHHTRFMLWAMQVYAVTYKDDPLTAAFVFRGTDPTNIANVVTDLCFGPVRLNTTVPDACPSYFGWPCLVSRGFQLAFDSVRDQLLPAWRNITAAGPDAVPTK